MNKMFASVLVLGVTSAAVGCGGIPGMKCKFNDGTVVSASGEVDTFLKEAMQLKKQTDELEAAWAAEMKGFAVALKLPADADDKAVLAKINANISASVKADASCKVSFEAKAEASASGSAAGKAGTGGTGGKASGSAAASVEVKFDVKCSASLKAEVKGELDITVASVKVHFPKLLGIAYRYKDLAAQIKTTVEAGAKAAKAVTDVSLVNEVNCAVSAMTNIKVEARVEFSVSASASAKGEAKG